MTGPGVEEDRALIERALDALNRRDPEAWLALLHPDVELHAFRGVQRGVDAARAWLGQPGHDTLDQELELQRVIEAGDQLVALIVRRLRWKEDGALADEQEIAHLYRIRDGRILRWQPFVAPADALRAAGLGAGETPAPDDG